jgi:aspartate oxidase
MEYNTDVLIIGGGSAGLHAAIEAIKYGVKVSLVYKSGGNATIMSAGGFAGNFSLDNCSDEINNKFFAEDILLAGRNINCRKIVDVVVKNSSFEINELKSLGVSFIEDGCRNLKLFHASGHRYPRTVRCTGGNTRQYYSTIRKKALDLGVNIISNVNILKLIKGDDGICGAIGVYREDIVYISCSSIILATGGNGANYNFSTHRKGIQGNGLTMALDVGASLVDMEFMQFMPTTIAAPEKLSGLIVTDTLRGEGAVLLNKNYERFMEKYSPIKKDMDTRDKIAKSIFQEIYEGRGTSNNFVFLDARHIDREKIKQSFTNYEILIKYGIDPKNELIEVSPASHYTCGGIKIDENAYTNVDGLWAAGEVAGGLHGANRLGSVALTENLVFGKIAGKNAAIYSLNKRTAVNKKPYVNVNFENKYVEKYEEIIKKLRFNLSNNAGIVREEKSLSKGLKEVKDILNEINEMAPKNKEFTLKPLHMQISSFANLTYCILKSCEMRKESRGTHFRADYPKENNEFLKRIIIYQNNSELVHCSEELNN